MGNKYMLNKWMKSVARISYDKLIFDIYYGPWNESPVSLLNESADVCWNIKYK